MLPPDYFWLFFLFTTIIFFRFSANKYNMVQVSAERPQQFVLDIR